MNTEQLTPLLRSTISSAQAMEDSIPSERKKTLRSLAQWIAERDGREALLVFICTHNSRRSHFGQIWAQVAAWVHGLDHVRTFSGGTEATAFHSNAIRALQEQGFDISIELPGKNPLYIVRSGRVLPEIRAFSKRYDDETDPSMEFAAIMTCSDADEACPFIPGAAARFSTPYDDPKAADGSDQEAIVYAQRSLQIASEMLYMMKMADG